MCEALSRSFNKGAGVRDNEWRDSNPIDEQCQHESSRIFLFLQMPQIAEGLRLNLHVSPKKLQEKMLIPLFISALFCVYG